MIKIRLVKQSESDSEKEHLLRTEKQEAIFFARHQFQKILQKNLKMPVSIVRL